MFKRIYKQVRTAALFIYFIQYVILSGIRASAPASGVSCRGWVCASLIYNLHRVPAMVPATAPLELQLVPSRKSAVLRTGDCGAICQRKSQVASEPSTCRRHPNPAKFKQKETMQFGLQYRKFPTAGVLHGTATRSQLLDTIFGEIRFHILARLR